MKISESELLQRRERIINTAFRLFCQKGIEKITLINIAKQANVSESTIYRYFINKPRLVLSTLDVLWHSIATQLENKVDRYPEYTKMSGIQQIAVYLEVFRTLYMENADYVVFSYEAKLYLQRNCVSLTQVEFDSLMMELKEPCVAALQKGKQDGTIPVKICEEDLFYAIWGSIRGYMVKIVIYNALCKEENPWISRYEVLKNGILCALSSGWNH